MSELHNDKDYDAEIDADDDDDDDDDDFEVDGLNADIGLEDMPPNFDDYDDEEDYEENEWWTSQSSNRLPGKSKWSSDSLKKRGRFDDDWERSGW